MFFDDLFIAGGAGEVPLCIAAHLVLALEHDLAHAAHELVLLLLLIEDDALVFWLCLAVEGRDGQLQAVFLVFAEGVLLPRGQPLRDHLDVLQRGVLIVVFVDLSGRDGCFFLVRIGADQGEGQFLLDGEQFCDDVLHVFSSFPFCFLLYSSRMDNIVNYEARDRLLSHHGVCIQDVDSTCFCPQNDTTLQKRKKVCIIFKTIFPPYTTINRKYQGWYFQL